jgi:hypothetical protein
MTEDTVIELSQEICEEHIPLCIYQVENPIDCIESVNENHMDENEYMEDLCIYCDEWTDVNILTQLCKKCAQFTHKCELCEETKHARFTFEPDQDGKVRCKDCTQCRYCKMEKTGDSWNLKCFNPLCIFKCPGCEEIKPTHLKNMYGGLYKDVCMDCSECKRCGCQMWDYICSCRV